MQMTSLKMTPITVNVIMNYKSITSLELECTCVNCGGQDQWDKLMEGAVKANKKAINRLVKDFLPDLYHTLDLDYPNPYDYYRTETHLILVHSMIEYFLKFER